MSTLVDDFVKFVKETYTPNLADYLDIELAKELVHRGWMVRETGIGYVLVEPTDAQHPGERL